MQEIHTTIHRFPIMQDAGSGFLALYAALFVFVFTSAAAAGLFFFNQSQDQAQAKLIEQIRLKEEDLRPKLLDQIFSLDKKLKNISLILSSHNFVSNTIFLIEKNTHPRVQFLDYSFSRSPDEIKMKGHTSDFAALARQIAFLESDPNIDSIQFGGIKKSDKGGVDFNITIFLKQGFVSARP